MTTVARLLRSAMLSLPEGMVRRLLPRRLRWDPSAVQTAIAAPGSGISLLIAPANSAGQAHLWARAARERLAGVRAANLMTVPLGGDAPAFNTDFAVPLAATAFSRSWRQGQRDALRNGFTHVLAESGRGPYGDDSGISAIMAELSSSGLAAGTLWHGSDIRLPSAHAAAEPDSPFGTRGTYPSDRTARLERAARERLHAIEKGDWPVFVSTLGLMDVPRATWLPVVVDIERWRTETEPMRGEGKPVVAYAPSNAALKGDDAIDIQLRRLEDDGIIRYRRIRDIPSAQMPHVYQTADVVLDQFRIGDYGVAACEAMAAGRPVIGHVSELVRERVRTATGHNLPIIESRYGDVGRTVRELISDRDALRACGEEGTRFVADVHDGALSAAVLADFLGASPPGPFGSDTTRAGD